MELTHRIDRMASMWTDEERKQCVEETPSCFKYGSALMSYISSGMSSSSGSSASSGGSGGGGHGHSSIGQATVDSTSSISHHSYSANNV